MADQQAGQVVVAAAVLHRDPHGDRVLACRRRFPPEAAGRWELPGGKVEAGETREAALVREIGEELGCLVEVGEWLDAEGTIERADGTAMRLHAAYARITAGVVRPREHEVHDEVRWLAHDELDEVDWLEPDRPFLPLLRVALGGEPEVEYRAVFFDESDAEEVVERLGLAGWEARVERERYQGEDDDEDHPWAVLTDAPRFTVELLVDEFAGWLDLPEQSPSAAMAPTPLDLPAAPKRIKRPDQTRQQGSDS